MPSITLSGPTELREAAALPVSKPNEQQVQQALSAASEAMATSADGLPLPTENLTHIGMILGPFVVAF